VTRSLGLNVLAMMLAKTLPAAVAFAINIAVARIAGVDTLGAYANLLALQMIFQALTGAGMHLLVAREVAAAPANASSPVQQATVTGLFSGIVGSAVSALYSVFVLPADQVVPALILTSTVLPAAFIAVQEGVFVGTRKHHLIAVVAILENSVKLAAAAAALAGGYGLIGISVAIAASRLIAFVVGAHLVRRLGVIAVAGVRGEAVMRFARELAPFAALFVVSMIYFRIGVPIVQLIAGTTDTGVLAAAVTLYGALLLLPESVLSASYPRLCAAFNASRDGFVTATWLVANGLTVTLVAVAMLLIAASDLIVTTIYGPAFGPAGAVLRLFAVALPIHALNGALGQALQSSGHQRVMVRVVVTALVVHVALTIVLVRAFGVQGAAVAMILSSTVVTVGALWTLHTRLGAVRLSMRAACTFLAIAAPLVYLAVVANEHRVMLTAGALLWVAVVVSSHGRIIRADVERVRGVFAAASPGAIA
jgi:O-antigen/teichoic acid export membrane protein